MNLQLAKSSVFLALFLMPLYSWANEKTRYNMAYTSFPPFFLKQPDKDGKLGISGELVKAIFAKAGLNVKLSPTPHARISVYAKQGNVAFITAGANPNTDFVYLPVPAIPSKLYIVGKEEALPTTAEALRGKRIASVRGFKLFNLAPIKEQKETTHTIVGSVKAAIEMLRLNRVDYVVAFKGPLHAHRKATENFYKKLVYSHPKGGYPLAIPKAYPNSEVLYQTIKQAFEDLVKSGVIDRENMILN